MLKDLMLGTLFTVASLLILVYMDATLPIWGVPIAGLAIMGVILTHVESKRP